MKFHKLIHFECDRQWQFCLSFLLRSVSGHRICGLLFRNAFSLNHFNFEFRSIAPQKWLEHFLFRMWFVTWKHISYYKWIDLTLLRLSTFNLHSKKLIFGHHTETHAHIHTLVNRISVFDGLQTEPRGTNLFHSHRIMPFELMILFFLACFAVHSHVIP